MDFAERDKLVRRICHGKLFCVVNYQHKNIDAIFTDPSQEIKCQADWRYDRLYNEYKSSGELITLSESYDILKKDGIWTDKLQLELEATELDIKELQSKINAFKFKKAEQRALMATMEKGKKRVEELNTIKNQLWHTTIECSCDNAQKRFIVSKITELEDMELLKLPTFLDTLIVYYYKENSLSISKIRELARTDPWRLYWTVSKETGTPLFPRAAVELTDMQYALTMWTRIYDFAYESSNRPSDDVIKNDDQFDAWYKQECEKIDNEVRRGSTERNLPGSAFGGQEVFIPADAEGAKEVYELNNFDAKNRIAQRQKALEKNSVLSEAELPDIRRDLKMEINRLANQSAAARSA